ncbi:hypothetical protein KL86CLO1_11106 [uncultured Eubacteriales bacterium]|uniref:Uncharacterized protein n=1 Tax=uncultured Eubacteriales bacterium TaxID=172733 RepID=A0A212JHP4_9FIRM|nr:hypothetical protein KL86CLO1_11106 [uncultured Eubacteriales bacterium]
MKIIFEDGGTLIQSMFGFRGGVGIIYENTFFGILTFAILAIICILAVIGLFFVIGAMGRGRKQRKGETPGQRWLRTGKMD